MPPPKKKSKIISKNKEPQLWLREPKLYPKAVEAFRVLKNRVIRFNEKEGIKTILLTGVDRQSGVSSVAFNLSLTCGRDLPDRRILLIDANMHHASLHSSFELPIEPGLMNLLYSNNLLHEITYESSLPNLHLIPFGQTYEDRPAPFTLPSFKIFLEQVAEQYELIIIDSDACLKSDHTQ
ncbi:MAG: hypothetical protein D3908_12440, partial [Candidatus Electrothrix sp. AUS4]|nr:hypothetical protein [Candidatus Electrothrix sp. AUS4]